MNTDDLTAAVERLRDSTRGIGGQLSDDIRRVLAALESAQQDARRYRAALLRTIGYLRENGDSDATAIALNEAWRVGITEEELDAAVDAAMGEGNA